MYQNSSMQRLQNPCNKYPQAIPMEKNERHVCIIFSCRRNLDSFVHKRYPADMIRILGVTAHPDDEAGAFGGSLLLYNSRGAETYVICLTEGQAATNRGTAKSDEELGMLRRAEFEASCRLLRVTGSEMLKYPDGALDRVNLLTVVADEEYADKAAYILTMGRARGP